MFVYSFILLIYLLKQPFQYSVPSANAETIHFSSINILIEFITLFIDYISPKLPIPIFGTPSANAEKAEKMSGAPFPTAKIVTPAISGGS
jgi:hypothetical protein